MDPVAEIKERLDVVDVVKEYISLKPAGSNFKGNCPFHQEKSPSFMVSPGKQIWHCFGCSEGGDIFKFVMQIEGLGFPEALRMLAERAGVTLQKRDPQYVSRTNRLRDCMDLAAGFFQQALLRSDQASFARAYLAKRGLASETIDSFGLGYSLPDNDRLYQFLLSRKFSSQEIEDLGLALKSQRGSGYYDRFRDRLMFPIRDVHGQVVGFGGRILQEKEDAAKYINSPQTVLYDKSKIVYGLDRAKSAIRKSGEVVLVEGYMDCIASHQAGVENVVASSGTALTSDQVGALKRFTNRFCFSFDTDSAGVNATQRGIDLALSAGIDVRVVQLPSDDSGKMLYKDPDECVSRDPDAWRTAIEGSVSFVEFYITNALKEGIPVDAHARKEVVRKILSMISFLPDRIEQDVWVKRVAEEFGISESILWEELSGYRGARAESRERFDTAASQDVFATQKTARVTLGTEDLFLSLLVGDPALGKDIVKDIDEELFTVDVAKALYKVLKIMYSEECAFEDGFQGVLNRMDDHGDGSHYITTLHLMFENEYGARSQDERFSILTDLASSLKQKFTKRRLGELQVLMQQAERAGDSQAMKQYIEEFGRLNSR